MPKEIVQLSDRIQAPPGAYSPAVTGRATDRSLFISGQLAFGPDGELVGRGDARAQTEQVFKNLRVILEDAGGSVEDLVKITIFLKDIADAPHTTDVRRAFYGDVAPPATTTVEARLVKDEWLIEVEAIAFLPSA